MSTAGPRRRPRSTRRSSSAEGTRYAPALKLASQIISASTLPRREVVVDLRLPEDRLGEPQRDRRFPEGTTITPVDVGGAAARGHRRHAGHDRPRQHRRPRPRHRGGAAHQHGRRGADRSARRCRSADATCRRSTVTVPARGAQQVRVHLDRRAERRDEGLGAHHARFAARRTTSAEFHDRARRGRAGARRRAGVAARRTRACSCAARWRSATGRRFRVEVKTDRRAHAARFRRALARGARRGRSARPAQSARGCAQCWSRRGWASCSCPATERTETWRAGVARDAAGDDRPVIDRTSSMRAARCRRSTTRSPVFELFNAPRSGDFSTARFYRYRALVADRRRDVLGALRRRVAGAGRAARWVREASSCGRRRSTRTGRTLPLQPVFLPFVHQLGKHAGRYADPRPSFVAGRGARSVATRRAHGAVHPVDAAADSASGAGAGVAVRRARARDGDGPESSRHAARTRVLRAARAVTRPSAAAGRSP